jgi:signal transduction histidine kinase
LSYRVYKWVLVALPPTLVGGFEYIRHDYLMPYLSMQTGNFYILLLVLVLSLLSTMWVFRTLDRMNQRLFEEQSARAVYMERERLARELHDNIAQTLFFVNVKLKRGQIEEARTAVSMVDQQVRQAIFNLRSTPEEGSSLQTRIQKWISEWSDMTGIDVNADIQLPKEEFFSPAEEILLFGIVQEAFANIRKHARATTAAIKLGADHQLWQLTIQDNGTGLPPDKPRTGKFGLTMMEERVRQLEAALEIRSLENGGVEIIVVGKKGGKERWRTAVY